MSKRKQAGGPGLFGDEPVGLDAYGKPAGMVAAVATGESFPERERLRPIVAELAAEVIGEALATFGVSGPAIDRLDEMGRKARRLETAVRRGIDEICTDDESSLEPGSRRALAILRECLIPEGAEVASG